MRIRCPFCGSKLRVFLPGGLKHPVLKEKKIVGGGYRLNALCPVCGSKDRERLVYLYLLHKTDIFNRHNKVLHVAPEANLEAVLRSRPTIDYVTADLYDQSVTVRMDITDMAYPDNSFDVIICNHVLEHTVDDRKAMGELFRTLKPGGYAILQVPISLSLENTHEDHSITAPSERERAFGQADHLRIYAKKDYRNRLEQVGFRVAEFNWRNENKNFGGPTNKFGLIKKESVYIARKKY